MKHFNFFRYKNYIKNNRVISQISKKLSLIIVLLFVINFLVFTFFLRTIYSNNIKKSNSSIVEQIATSYESIISQITYYFYKTVAYDNELIQLTRSVQTGNASAGDIYNKLNQIVFSSPYISCAYLYFPKLNMIYNSYNNSISTFENFQDADVFSQFKDNINYTLDPRTVVFNKDDPNPKLEYFYSYISYTQLYKSDAILVVNVDIQKINYKILNTLKTKDGFNFYAFNPTNQNIVLNDNEQNRISLSKLTTDSTEVSYKGLGGAFFYTDIFVQSVFHAVPLNWNFVIENRVIQNNTVTKFIFNFINISIFILLTILTVIILFVNLTLKPLKKIVVEYGGQLWKDYLLGTSNSIDKVYNKFDMSSIVDEKRYFIVLSVQKLINIKSESSFTEISIECKLLLDKYFENKELEGLQNMVVNMGASHTSIIISISNRNHIYQELESFCSNLVYDIYQTISTFYDMPVFTGVSNFYESISQLPLAYSESFEALQFKITTSNNCIRFSDIKDKKLKCSYFYDKEKQIINNLLIGDLDESIKLLEDIIEEIVRPEFRAEDIIVKNMFFQLQTAILWSVKGLGSHYELDSGIKNVYSIDGIKTHFNMLFQSITSAVSKKNIEIDSNFKVKILSYIEDNYTNQDFNLNKAAEDLKLSRNTLSKIIKECTGLNFTDLINSKKIALSKKLLLNKDLSVDSISLMVGYNYSVYFIKVFKLSEGITPGEFKKNNLA